MGGAERGGGRWEEGGATHFVKCRVPFGGGVLRRGRGGLEGALRSHLRAQRGFVDDVVFGFLPASGPAGHSRRRSLASRKSARPKVHRLRGPESGLCPRGSARVLGASTASRFSARRSLVSRKRETKVVLRRLPQRVPARLLLLAPGILPPVSATNSRKPRPRTRARAAGGTCAETGPRWRNRPKQHPLRQPDLEVPVVAVDTANVRRPSVGWGCAVRDQVASRARRGGFKSAAPTAKGKLSPTPSRKTAVKSAPARSWPSATT